MLILDTHVALWLYTNDIKKISKRALGLLEEHDLKISAATFLEIKLLHEVRRVLDDSSAILEALTLQLGITIVSAPFEHIVQYALPLSWTRDPFDRLIAATALCHNCLLLTKDSTILENLPCAVWD